MKSTAFTLAVCLASAALSLAAQDVLTPTNRIDLFNGRDFAGWTFCMRSNADPAKTWTITNGVIHCTGKPAGYVRTRQACRDYKLTVEWRFVKVTPKADNTGVLVHMQLPDAVWPVCIQNQGKSGRQGDLFVMMGAECKEHRGQDRNTPVPFAGAANENPVGDWNTNVTVCAGNAVEAYVNGRFMNRITECTISSGFVGFQSEGGEIEIRKVLLAPLK